MAVKTTPPVWSEVCRSASESDAQMVLRPLQIHLFITFCSLAEPTPLQHPTPCRYFFPSWSQPQLVWQQNSSLAFLLLSDFSWVPMCGPFPHLPVSETMMFFMSVLGFLLSARFHLFSWHPLLTIKLWLLNLFLTEMERVHIKHLVSAQERAYSLSQLFIESIYVPGLILATVDTEVSKMDKNPCPHEASILTGRTS